MSAVGVLAVYDDAKMFVDSSETGYETPYHLMGAIDEAHAAIARLMDAAEPFASLLFEPSELSRPIALEIDPADVAAIRAALAACKGESA